MTGDDIVYEIAQKYYRGNMTSASDKLLADFRKGYLGYCSLESPGMSQELKDVKKKIKNDKEKMEQIRIAKNLAEARSEYMKGRYDVSEKCYSDQFGDPIDRKLKKMVSLDLKQGDYEGW